jgi:hypothetical protein
LAAVGIYGVLAYLVSRRAQRSVCGIAVGVTAGFLVDASSRGAGRSEG